MIKRFLLAWFLVYLVSGLSGYLVHHLLLGEQYRQVAASMHANVMGRIWAFILVSIAGSFFFTLIYTRWNKTGTIREGLLYGLILGLFVTLSEYLSAYASSDAISLWLTTEWIVFGLLQYCLSGLVLSLIFSKVHRNSQKST
jgi:Na+(H+)/acetate symporter ActP